VAPTAKQIEIAQKLDESGGDGAAFISCHRKRRYPTFADAFVEACRVTPKKAATFRMKVYVCLRCAGFHLAQIELSTQAAVKPKTKSLKPGRSALSVVKEQCNNQMKRIMELQEQLKSAKAAIVPQRNPVWRRIGNSFSRLFERGAN
jgi:hypothetical protein